ncbi:hypothetical protein EYF80_017718 [Liparis tanakae]|uniref:DUF7886 domain-containing protein n=1 Tax=Liparis tanakae TaxID=230148 RepID=A0A4Z2I266_9TELE|nr:hypothetical protein EYF80_017718 [Liparis tanakae]
MSSGSKREREQRKRLQHFLSDLALLGSLQGFKYFQPWLRGKEELLLTVVNEDLGWRSPGFAVSRASSYSSTSSCIRVWDVISELVCLCTVPSPSNPFALDVRYIQSLPLPDRFLVTGALLNFLEMYVVYGNRDELHYDKVVEEVRPLRRLHVQSLLEFQRHRESSWAAGSPAEQDSSGEENI